MNNLIEDALLIPVSDPRQTISVSPVVIEVEERPIPLELRVTAPLAGDNLPVILLSHGHGPSLYLPSKEGYGPLVNFYAEHGFVVIQPTHLNSKVAGLPADAPGGPLFWRSRVAPLRSTGRFAAGRGAAPRSGGAATPCSQAEATIRAKPK